MFRILLPTLLLATGIAAATVLEPPAYDPTDPSQVAETEGQKQGVDDGLAGPAIDPDNLDPQLRRRGDMMSDTMAGLSIEATLEARCGQCHGVQKQKAGVQVVPVESMFMGPRKDWVVLPGQPQQSILLERISFPAGHDDIMPPEGRPMTAEQVQAIENWIKEGATAESARKGSDLPMQRGPRSRRSQTVRPRAWMQMYMALDLTPEQRSKAMQTSQKLQSEMRNFQETHGQQMKKLQERIRSFEDRSNPTEELLKLRGELQAIQGKQPKVETVQETLWMMLTTDQQDAMRQALAERSQDRRGGRDERTRRNARDPKTDSDSMDDATRKRIRLLMEERRKARDQAGKPDSDSE